MKITSIALAGLFLLQGAAASAETIETPLSRIQVFAAAKTQLETRVVSSSRELSGPVRQQVENALRVTEQPVTEKNLYCSDTKTNGLAPCNSSFVRLCADQFMGRFAGLPQGYGACLVHWGQS